MVKTTGNTKTDDLFRATYWDTNAKGLRIPSIIDGPSITKNNEMYYSPVNELILKEGTEHFVLPEGEPRFQLLFNPQIYKKPAH